jgi:hypothetical protein
VLHFSYLNGLLHITIHQILRERLQQIINLLILWERERHTKTIPIKGEEGQVKGDDFLYSHTLSNTYYCEIILLGKETNLSARVILAGPSSTNSDSYFLYVTLYLIIKYSLRLETTSIVWRHLLELTTFPYINPSL